MEKTFGCPYCTKKFRDQSSVYSHAKAKHPNQRRKQLRPTRAYDCEPSMAELFIDAELNRAMGIRNDAWIEDMLP